MCFVRVGLVRSLSFFYHVGYILVFGSRGRTGLHIWDTPASGGVGYVFLYHSVFLSCYMKIYLE